MPLTGAVMLGKLSDSRRVCRLCTAWVVRYFWSSDRPLPLSEWGRTAYRKRVAPGSPSLRRGHADWQQMSESLATLYVQGVDVDWAGFDRDYPRRRVVLPTYPFQRKRYWVDAPEQKSHTARHHRAVDEARHPLLGPCLRSPLVKEIFWQARCSTASVSFLADYQVYGMVAVPPLAYLEMALAAATEVFGPGGQVLQVDIGEALILQNQNNEARTVQLVLTPEEDDHATFQVISCSSVAAQSTAWIAHATGKVSIARSASPSARDRDGFFGRVTNTLPR